MLVLGCNVLISLLLNLSVPPTLCSFIHQSPHLSYPLSSFFFCFFLFFYPVFILTLLNTHVSTVIVLVISLIPDVNLSSFPITTCIPLYCTTVTYLIIIIFFLLQLVISDVHFRYEDATTRESVPFSFGITIEKLSAHSTNENWVSVDNGFMRTLTTVFVRVKFFELVRV